MCCSTTTLLILSFFNAQAGIILCCLGCAIFGITEVPTDGVVFDTGDFAYSNAEQQTAASPPTAAPYIPPPPPNVDVKTEQPAAAALVPETRQGDSVVIPPPTAEPVVDLLSDPVQAQGQSAPQDARPGELNELD
jgi:hypothetical protein